MTKTMTPAEAAGQPFGFGNLGETRDYIHGVAVEAAKILLARGEPHGNSSALACGFAGERYGNQRLGLAARFEAEPRNPNAIKALRIRIGTSPLEGNPNAPQEVMTADYTGSASSPREMLEQLAKGGEALARTLHFRLQHGTWENQLKDAARAQAKQTPAKPLDLR